MDLRTALNGKTHKIDIEGIISEVCGKNDDTLKNELYRLMFDDDKRISDNAALVFSHFCSDENVWLYDKHDELIDEVMRTGSNTKRRILLTILLKQKFRKDNLRTDFIDYCLNNICALNVPIAISASCIKLAYTQCRFYPELLDELKVTLTMMDAAILQPGVKTARRKILNKLT